MTEQTNADLIAEAQEVSASEHEELGEDAYVGGLLDRLAAALKVAEQRAEDLKDAVLVELPKVRNERDQYAAVVEKVRKAIDGPHPANSGLDSYTLAHLSPLLDAAPAEALRERDAEKWGEGAKWVVANQGHELNAYLREVIDNHNPYRKEADRG